MATKKEFKTVKYFKVHQLAGLDKTPEVETALLDSNNEDNVAALLSINSPVKIEKIVNITKEGFGKIKELIVT